MTVQERRAERPLPLTQRGPLGKAALFVTSMLIAVVAHGWWTIPALVVVLLVSGLPARRNSAMRTPATRRWFMPVFVLTTVLLGLFFGPGDATLAGITVSTSGLAIATQMVLRVITITIAVARFAGSVSVSELTRLFETAGLKGLGFALGVAFNMLPTTYAIVTTAFYSLRLRGGFRRNRLRSLRLLFVTIVDNALRHADEIVAAAESRAFTVDCIQTTPLAWNAADLVTSAAMLLLTLVFVVV